MKKFNLKYIFILIVFSSCNNIPEIENAKKLYNNGQFEEAIGEYDKAIAKSPNDCNLFAERSYCYQVMLEFDKEIIDLLKAIRLGCADDKIYNNLGNAYFKTGKTPLAIISFHKALESNSSNGTAASNLGICYYDIGQKHLAEKYLKRAIEIDPDTADNYYYLGVQQQNNNNFESALHNLNKAINLKSGFPIFYIKRAAILGALGLYEKALEDIDYSLNYNLDQYNMVEALHIRVLCLISLEKTNEACIEIMKLKAIEPTFDCTVFDIDCEQ